MSATGIQKREEKYGKVLPSAADGGAAHQDCVFPLAHVRLPCSSP